MGADGSPRSRRGNAGATAGPFWFAGWLFTLAFARLVWWKALLALLLWPYYLAVAVR